MRAKTASFSSPTSLPNVNSKQSFIDYVSQGNENPFDQAKLDELRQMGVTAAVRNYNPGNIKYVPKSYAMRFIEENKIPVQKGSKATDGGNFITFKYVEDGLRVKEALLDYAYSDMTVDAAMKRWSNNGYGAEILPGIKPTTKIKQLTAEQKRQLALNQIKREDSTMYKILESSLKNKKPANNKDLYV